MKLVEMEKNNWSFEEDSAFTSEILERFDQALDTWEKGHDEEAEKMLHVVIAECPNHIDALQHLSLLYLGQGREVEAYIYCQAAVGIGLHALPEKFRWKTAKLEWGWLENRPFLRAYHNLGLWHLDNARYDEAVGIFKRLLSVNPNDNQGVRHLLPHCWFETNELSKIVTHCRKYRKDVAPEILYSQALALAGLGRNEEALEALKNCVAELPLVGRELLKKRHPKPKSLIEGYIAHGDADQAYYYWEAFGKYWSESESALELLRQVVKR